MPVRQAELRASTKNVPKVVGQDLVERDLKPQAYRLLSLRKDRLTAVCRLVPLRAVQSKVLDGFKLWLSFPRRVHAGDGGLSSLDLLSGKLVGRRHGECVDVSDENGAEG